MVPPLITKDRSHFVVLMIAMKRIMHVVINPRSLLTVALMIVVTMITPHQGMVMPLELVAANVQLPKAWLWQGSQPKEEYMSEDDDERLSSRQTTSIEQLFMQLRSDIATDIE